MEYLSVFLFALFPVLVGLFVYYSRRGIFWHRSQVAQIDPQELQRLLLEKKCDIIDVRTDEEFQEGHIDGALHLNFYDPDFLAQIDALPKEKSYVVYCRSGNRSAKTALYMMKNGFPKLHDLSGGIMSWQSAGLPVRKED